MMLSAGTNHAKICDIALFYYKDSACSRCNGSFVSIHVNILYYKNKYVSV